MKRPVDRATQAVSVRFQRAFGTTARVLTGRIVGFPHEKDRLAPFFFELPTQFSVETCPALPENLREFSLRGDARLGVSGIRWAFGLFASGLLLDPGGQTR